MSYGVKKDKLRENRPTYDDDDDKDDDDDDAVIIIYWRSTVLKNP